MLPVNPIFCRVCVCVSVGCAHTILVGCRAARDDDETYTPRAQVDSNWYESSPGVWSSSNWEQEAENASASAPVRTM